MGTSKAGIVEDDFSGLGGKYRVEFSSEVVAFESCPWMIGFLGAFSSPKPQLTGLVSCFNCSKELLLCGLAERTHDHSYPTIGDRQ